MDQNKRRPIPAGVRVDEEEIQMDSQEKDQDDIFWKTGHRGQHADLSPGQKSPSMTPNGPMDNLKTPPTIARNRATPRSGGTPSKFDSYSMVGGIAVRTPRTLRDVTAGPLSARAAWTPQLSARSSAPRSARLLLSSRSYRGGMSYRLMQDESGAACPRTHGLDTQAAARQAARKIADLLAAQAKQRMLEQQLAMQVQEDPGSEEEWQDEVGVSDHSSEPGESQAVAAEGSVVERESEMTEVEAVDTEEAAVSTRKDPLTKAEARGFFKQSAGNDTPSAKAASVSGYFDSTVPVVQGKKQLPPTPRGVVPASPRDTDSLSCIVFGADINGFRPASLAEYRREAKGQYAVMRLVDESVITRHKGPRRAFIPDVRPFIPEGRPASAETPRDSFLSRLFNFGSSSQPRPKPPPQPFSGLPSEPLPSAIVPGSICF